MSGPEIAALAFSFGFSFHAELTRRHICTRCVIRKLAGKALTKVIPTKKLIHEQPLSWFEKKRIGLALTIATGLVVSEVEFSWLKMTFKEAWRARTTKKEAMSKMRNGQRV